MKFFLLAFGLSTLMTAVTANATSPVDAVKAMLGTYTGNWDFYDLDAQGNVQKTMAFTDVITLQNPQVGVDPILNKQRAFANVTDVQTLTYPQAGTRTSEFTEGYTIAADGSAGNHYFTFKYKDFVTETIEIEDAKNLYHYESDVSVEKYAALGITRTNVIFAKNYTTKSVTYVNGVERQDIAQTTTLVWKAADGSTQSRQFISMVGVHQRSIK